MSPLTGGHSYWVESTPSTEFPTLATDTTADVCVIGGGITGLLSAWELTQAGRSVVLLESGRLAQSVTGYTTAKLTSQHGLKYARLEREHGLEVATVYARANEGACARLIDLAEWLGLGLVEGRDAYIYSRVAARLDQLRAEVAAARRAGAPVEFVAEPGLPFSTVGAVCFRDQAQLHPRRLLLALADALTASGCAIFEQTKVTTVEEEAGRQRVESEDGVSVRADAVVVATLLPAAGVGQELRRHVYCHQGFVVAFSADEDPLPGGVYISAERPMRSLRTVYTDDKRLLLVGGGAYVSDPSSGDEPYDELERFGRAHFDVGAVEYRWTTQDYSSADGLPLIGRVGEAPVYVATGFGGWGMTTAAVAAALLREAICDGERPWQRVFSPRRRLKRADARVVSTHTSSGPGDEDVAERVAALGPGQAAVVFLDGELTGVHRDQDGALEAVSAVCTHLGGTLLWDVGQGSWVCPCHGSQFAPDGAVLAGPAQEPLAARAIELPLPPADAVDD